MLLKYISGDFHVICQVDLSSETFKHVSKYVAVIDFDHDHSFSCRPLPITDWPVHFPAGIFCFNFMNNKQIQ